MPDRRDPGEPALRSRQNARVREAREIARDPRRARREGLLVADGVQLVLEAIAARLACRLLLLDPDAPDAQRIHRAARARRLRVTPASRSVIDAVSTLTTPQAAVGLFERPAGDLPALLAAADAAQPLIAVLHGLQDPTNAGSLVRTALAAGLNGLVCTAGTVDPFHPKAVRAAMGASFRLPIACEVDAETLWASLRRGGYRLLSLDPHEGLDLRSTKLDRPTALILGREGSGLDPAVARLCDARLRIPMASGVESLGVAAAGAIAFYALSLDRLP